MEWQSKVFSKPEGGNISELSDNTRSRKNFMWRNYEVEKETGKPWIIFEKRYVMRLIIEASLENIGSTEEQYKGS